MNGDKLKCEQKAKHVGIWITSDFSNNTELAIKRGAFIGQANHVLSKYSKMDSSVKCKMIESYCCHFYGSETWEHSNCNFSRILTSWNISIRKAWNLPYTAHRYMLPVLARHEPQDIIYYKFLSMYDTMCNSKNEHVKFITKLAKTDAGSLLNQNLQVIANDLNVDLYNLLNNIPMNRSMYLDRLTDDQKHNIVCVIELAGVKNGVLDIPGFNLNEIQLLYEVAATM